jgi:flagellar motor component MotA
VKRCIFGDTDANIIRERETVQGDYTIRGLDTPNVDTGSCVFSLRDASLDELVGVLSSFCELARKQGILGFEEYIDTFDEALLNEGLKLILDIDTNDEFALFKAYLTARSIRTQMHLHIVKTTALEIARKHNPEAIRQRLIKVLDVTS